MISLVLAVLNAALISNAQAATPLSTGPEVEPTVDTSGVLDLEQTPEEKMVGSELPPTPESGSENPQDLLRSGPRLHAPKKSASAKAATHDGLPASLPLMAAPVQAHEKGADPDLPPLPTEPTPEQAQAPAAEPIPAEEPTAESPPEAESAPMENVVVPSEPTEEAVASESEPSSGTTTRKWDRSIPMYDRENPTWGIDLHGSLQAFGTSLKSEQLDTNGAGTGVIEDTDIKNFGVGVEYEPEFLQGLGVVSLGPSFNLYIAEPAGDLTDNSFSIYSLGFSAKYQLKFMRGQAFIPFVGYESQWVHFDFKRGDSGKGTTIASGLTFGALIGLNWMEPSAAHSLWADTGIKRSYLVAEFKDLQSDDDLISSDGQAIYFGLRLEY